MSGLYGLCLIVDVLWLICTLHVGSCTVLDVLYQDIAASDKDKLSSETLKFMLKA